MRRPNIDIPLVLVTVGMLIITLAFAAYFTERRHLTDHRAKITASQVAALRQAVCTVLGPIKASQTSTIARARAFPFPATDGAIEPLCSPRLPFTPPILAPSSRPRKIKVTLPPTPAPTVTMTKVAPGPTVVVTKHPKTHHRKKHTPTPSPTPTCTFVNSVGVCLPSPLATQKTSPGQKHKKHKKGHSHD